MPFKIRIYGTSYLLQDGEKSTREKNKAVKYRKKTYQYSVCW